VNWYDVFSPKRNGKNSARRVVAPLKPLLAQLLRWNGSGGGLDALHQELLFSGTFKLLCSRLLLALQALALFVLSVGLGSSCRCNISSHDSQGSQHASAKD
jgi:hypothetical protein